MKPDPIIVENLALTPIFIDVHNRFIMDGVINPNRQVFEIDTFMEAVSIKETVDERPHGFPVRFFFTPEQLLI